MATDRMLLVEEAQQIVLDSVFPLGVERISLSQAFGRVLAEDVAPKYDIPPHNNSSVDGYAVQAEDTREASGQSPCRLAVLEEIPAGAVPVHQIEPGKTSRIMTGAVLPVGANAVVMVENTVQEDGYVQILKPVRFDQNVRHRGEDVKNGQIVLSPGTVLGPGEIGLLASFQRSFITVMRQPTVTILSTGDEIVDIDEALTPGKIVNSNSYSLAAMVKEAGGRPVSLSIARDTEEEIRSAIQSALNGDVILSTGGVSVGDYDFVKKVIQDLGAEMKLWRVQMKPGKPLAFGLLQGKPFFGLPGNPVSCMVSFLLFTRAALRKIMGYPQSQWQLPIIKATITNDLTASGDRRHYLRAHVIYSDGQFLASTVSGQGSGMLSSMSGTNGLVVVETGLTSIAEGTQLSVLLMRSVW